MSPVKRNETPRERADRNFTELIQEIRVAQTGVQVLFAFLLTLPFTARFPTVGPGTRNLYYAALIFSAASAVLLVAPTMQHRILFRMDDKAYLLRRAHLLAVAGVSMLGLAIVSALMLVTDVLFGARAMHTVLIGGSLFVGAVWFAAPLARRRVVNARRRSRKESLAAGGDDELTEEEPLD